LKELDIRYRSLGKTEIKLPPIIHGTSSLGNLYDALSCEIKETIVQEIFKHSNGPVVLDTAGKYGAGLALEVIGRILRDLQIPEKKVIISNKLGWLRTSLKSPEPTFEPGIWKNLKHDALQNISYDGILECWEQGCQLLGNRYTPQIVSVHDPDEFLADTTSATEREERFQDIIDSYRALRELKQQGATQAIGVGAKDWHVIREISRVIDLDWVMLASSYTVFDHPPELLKFIDELMQKDITIINSAVFNSGFLTGGKYFDYRVLDPDKSEDKPYFIWREKFFQLCDTFNVLPADVCVQFSMSHPGVSSIALNTSRPERVLQNIKSATAEIPSELWKWMKEETLIEKTYPYVG
jgi:D-threo-aldose 1-dehydrogenase